MPLLAALASAIGNTRRIQLKRGWSEPAILWAAIVGDSGTMKSPAMELALKPLRQRQGKAIKQHAEAALDGLVEAGFGHWKQSLAHSRGGRPTRRTRMAEAWTSILCGIRSEPCWPAAA
ncbi:MAG: DUF3987 domain-containing protein [Phycisphaerae bacterium]|nr:DUF3987 domain-containing protein [Phycisphaerae bacterium]